MPWRILLQTVVLRDNCCKLWYLENILANFGTWRILTVANFGTWRILLQTLLLGDIVSSSWPSIVCPTQTNKIELPLDYPFLYSTWPVFSNPNKNINFHNICRFWQLQKQIFIQIDVISIEMTQWPDIHIWRETKQFHQNREEGAGTLPGSQ